MSTSLFARFAPLNTLVAHHLVAVDARLPTWRVRHAP
jgi:hypothetical protein